MAKEKSAENKKSYKREESAREQEITDPKEVPVGCRVMLSEEFPQRSAFSFDVSPGEFYDLTGKYPTDCKRLGFVVSNARGIDVRIDSRWFNRYIATQQSARQSAQQPASA